METKQWYRSKTVWAALVAMVAGILQGFGIAGNIASEQESIVNAIMKLVELISIAVAIIGRLSATTKIEDTPKAGLKAAVVLLCAGLFTLSGCRAVTMGSEYRRQVEVATAAVTELDKRCQNGDEEACREGLAQSARTLSLIVDAMNGVESEVDYDSLQ